MAVTGRASSAIIPQTHKAQWKPPVSATEAWTRGLLRCGMAAGPVFVAAFLLEGAVWDGYRPLRHPVSSLALGPHESK